MVKLLQIHIYIYTYEAIFPIFPAAIDVSVLLTVTDCGLVERSSGDDGNCEKKWPEIQINRCGNANFGALSNFTRIKESKGGRFPPPKKKRGREKETLRNPQVGTRAHESADLKTFRSINKTV